MSGILKFTLRLAVIGGLLLFGAALVCGPKRIHKACDELHTNLESWLEENPDDPAALRRQLRELEREYPKKISAIRTDMAQLDSQINALDRRQALAGRVLELAREDLDSAPKARNASTIQRAQVFYTAQMENAQRDLRYLEEQRSRLSDLLERLEEEYATLRSEIFTLESQVETVARNRRMIELFKRRQESIAELGSSDVATIEQMRARLSQVIAAQEAELEHLGESLCQREYERRAREDLLIPEPPSKTRALRAPAALETVEIMR